ncbi:S41 family peptidase [Solitalea koreensis]|uniref:Carboxyl-terminal processing protease n=1 Tax=Solitalea koreensis TaxID=543615 RepID=A0A521EF77_9SPHI|nr:S41 family peptidase [Solitalea koreensis]SMO82567.1 carboxyl-terminal processing protease [Solitalea koreensis]
MKRIKLFFKSPKKTLLTLGVIGFVLISFKVVEENIEVTKSLDIFSGIYKEINLSYVESVEPSKVTKTAIDAMLTSLDPYTEFIPEAGIEDFKMNYISSQYGGIGALIFQKDNRTYVSDIYEGFPAQKADLRAGDQIIAINGVDLAGKNNQQISDLLKGQKNSLIILTVYRDGSGGPVNKKLQREDIKFPNVSYYGVVNNKVGYIKLDRFLENAGNEVKKAFINLKKNDHITSLIIDLRGNGGGILQEAVKILNLFIVKGEVLVTQKGRSAANTQSYHANANPIDPYIPIVVLVDDGTASASEILAGAMQDLDRGVIVGQRSFGKGLVQQTFKLPYNSLVKITVARYYTPSGRCVQKIDYLHRKSGEAAVNIADSLITEFKTKGGRIVYDGRGISPDVLVKPYYYSNLVTALVDQNLIFDYATEYRHRNNNARNPRDFSIKEDDYLAFVKSLSNKGFDYTPKSERILDELKKTTEKEKYYDQISSHYTQLKNRVDHNKSEDLSKYKDEIEQVLENEIMSRYYFQRGRIESSFRYDREIKEALRVINEKNLYSSILKGAGPYKTIGKNDNSEANSSRSRTPNNFSLGTDSDSKKKRSEDHLYESQLPKAKGKHIVF